MCFMPQVCMSVNKLSESTDTGVIIVRPIRQRPSLDELLDNITPDNLPDFTDIEWGQPKGGEEW